MDPRVRLVPILAPSLSGTPRVARASGFVSAPSNSLSSASGSTFAADAIASAFAGDNFPLRIACRGLRQLPHPLRGLELPLRASLTDVPARRGQLFRRGTRTPPTATCRHRRPGGPATSSPNAAARSIAIEVLPQRPAPHTTESRPDPDICDQPTHKLLAARAFTTCTEQYRRGETLNPRKTQENKEEFRFFEQLESETRRRTQHCPHRNPASLPCAS